MSWIVALAAISLAAGCASHDPDIYCGDDVIHEGSLAVDVEGLEDDVTYDITVEAEGQTIALQLDPAAPGPSQTVQLDDLTTMSASMFTLADFGGAPDNLNIEITEEKPVPSNVYLGYLWGYGPAEVTVTVSAGGSELGRKTFMPTYSRDFPHGLECPYTDNARVSMLVQPP